MKMPLIGIASNMAVVALVALNLTAYRARALLGHSDHWVPRPILQRADFLVRGALPMANLLIIGLWLGTRGSRVHPGLVGFESFGVVALALYLAIVIWVCNHHAVQPHQVVPGFLRSSRIPSQVVCSVILTLPQLALAWAGGRIMRRWHSRPAVVS